MIHSTLFIHHCTRSSFAHWHRKMFLINLYSSIYNKKIQRSCVKWNLTFWFFSFKFTLNTIWPHIVSRTSNHHVLQTIIMYLLLKIDSRKSSMQYGGLGIAKPLYVTTFSIMYSTQQNLHNKLRTFFFLMLFLFLYDIQY